MPVNRDVDPVITGEYEKSGPQVVPHRLVRRVGSWICDRCGMISLNAWGGDPGPVDGFPTCCGGERMSAYDFPAPNVDLTGSLKPEKGRD